MNNAAVKTPSQVAAGQPVSTWLGFLSPEDVVVWQEPGQLHRWLATRFAAADDESVFVAANRLALEAFRSRETAAAATVCALEVTYAAQRLKAGPSATMAMLGLQPVVNLVRLHGYSSDLDLARQGLAELEAIADRQPTHTFGLDLSADLMAAMGADLTRLTSFARANCLIETAKILWRRGLHTEMLAACRRLADKWPRSAVTGPFHAAEAPWLVDARDAVPVGPQAPTLGRIRQLHAVAQSPGADLETAERLYRHRGSDRHSTVLSLARERALLGDAFYQMGDPTRGGICFGDAHAGAAPVDPALANLIRSRWLGHAGAALVPPELPCARLSPDDIATLTEHAVARLQPTGPR